MKNRLIQAVSVTMLTIVISFLLSCNKQTAAVTPSNCDPSTSFKNQIKPILVSNCDLSGCHDGTNLPALADYSTSRDGAAQIQNAISRSIMPPNKSLSTANKNLILCWISNGTPNN